MGAVWAPVSAPPPPVVEALPSVADLVSWAPAVLAIGLGVVDRFVPPLKKPFFHFGPRDKLEPAARKQDHKWEM